MKATTTFATRTVTIEQREATRWPLIGVEEECAVLDVLHQGDLSCHPVTRELEEEYCKYFGRRYALAH